jgi:hypothetical protein
LTDSGRRSSAWIEFLKQIVDRVFAKAPPSLFVGEARSRRVECMKRRHDTLWNHLIFKMNTQSTNRFIDASLQLYLIINLH